MPSRYQKRVTKGNNTTTPTMKGNVAINHQKAVGKYRQRRFAAVVLGVEVSPRRNKHPYHLHAVVVDGVVERRHAA